MSRHLLIFVLKSQPLNIPYFMILILYKGILIRKCAIRWYLFSHNFHQLFTILLFIHAWSLRYFFKFMFCFLDNILFGKFGDLVAKRCMIIFIWWIIFLDVWNFCITRCFVTGLFFRSSLFPSIYLPLTSFWFIFIIGLQ